MKKMQLFICENFYPEYAEVLQSEEFEDVELRVFPSLCDQKGRKAEVGEMLDKADKQKGALICSKSCDALRLLPEDYFMETINENYCFSHLIQDEFLNYLTSQGNYIISSGWLKNWEDHIKNMGFDKETARRFFQESSKQLAFLDSRKDKNDEWLIKELSSYLGLPYIVVPIELEGLTLMLRSLVYKWRLHNQEQANNLSINELRNQCAEYSTVFDMLGKISNYAKRRDVIEQIKELFIMIFGAQSFSFWSDQSVSVPEEIKQFQSSGANFLLLKEENRFCVKITWKDRLYGIIDVSGFLFPQYIERYLNLAVEVSKISGLVFHNNIQYEKILESQKELKYLSYHDSMTELYNRTYINQILFEPIDDKKICVFMFDIDGLKYVNDNFGHAEGDKLIKSFAGILKQGFREDDILARVGGDEFVAILYGADNAGAMKERIQELIRINNKNIEEKHLTLSVSIGYAKSENQKGIIEDLIKKADLKMYEEKIAKC